MTPYKIFLPLFLRLAAAEFTSILAAEVESSLFISSLIEMETGDALIALDRVKVLVGVLLSIVEVWN